MSSLSKAKNPSAPTEKKENRTVIRIIRVLAILIIPFVVWNVLIPQSEYRINTDAKPLTLNNVMTPENTMWSINNADYPQDSSEITLSKELLSKPLPTNKWWLAAVYGTKSKQPLFVMPYSMKIDTSKIEYANSAKAVQPDAIFKSHNPELSLSIPGMASSVLTYYDDLVLKFQINSSADKIADLTIAKGSPYSYYTLQTSTASFKFLIKPTWKKIDDQNYLATLENGNNYLISTKVAKAFNTSDFGIDIEFTEPKDNKLTVSLITSPGLAADYAKFAFNTINSAEITFDNTDKQVNTYYKLNVENSDTIYGLIPNLYKPNNIKGDIGSIDSLRGTMKFYKMNNFKTSIDKPAVLDQFQVPDISAADVDTMETYYLKDLEETKYDNKGVYFAGKDLFKAANMLDMAYVIDKSKTKTYGPELLKTLEDKLVNWATYKTSGDDQYITYDKTRGGLIATPEEFGSAGYNDHHFHWGYYLYSFATVCKYDKVFCEQYRGFFDLLVNDIADIKADDTNFPRLRVFDLYEGHSWATGSTLFADGNNQESVSEAINAWYAIYKLGEVLGNKDYSNLGMWLYSTEVNSAENYWWNIYNDKNIFVDGYRDKIASLIWNGKMEYATFFSPRPEAKNAIIVLPVSGGSLYLSRPEFAAGVLKELDNVTGSQYIVYEDILNQYRMLNGIPMLNTVKDMKLDGVNSRSYLFYQTLFFNKFGTLQRAYNVSDANLVAMGKGANLFLLKSKETDKKTVDVSSDVSKKLTVTLTNSFATSFTVKAQESQVASTDSSSSSSKSKSSSKSSSSKSSSKSKR